MPDRGPDLSLWPLATNAVAADDRHHDPRSVSNRGQDDDAGDDGRVSASRTHW